MILPIPLTGARQKFMAYVLSQLERPALMGAKGDDAFDCSGLVTCGIRHASDGALDLTKTHNANALGKATRPLLPTERPISGDLIFFDAEQDDPSAPGHGVDEHVGIVVDDNTAIDAAGATSRITTVAGAVAAGAKVRFQKGHSYRKSFRAIHRNVYLDKLDGVSR